MTSTVVIKAETHDAVVQQIFVLNGKVMPFDFGTEGTRKFRRHVIPAGETREMHVHANEALLVMEAPKDTPNG